MMNEHAYGSRSSRLPKFMLSDDADVRMLSEERSRELEAASIWRFTATGKGIVWDGVDVVQRLVYQDEPGEGNGLRRCPARHVPPGADVVLFTEVAGAPTVAMSVEVSREHIHEIVQFSGNFWLFV